MPRAVRRASADMEFTKQRRDMVEHQIAARGVRSELVLEAVYKVPREEFLPSSLREFAYEDTPLPIAEGQTISQPYIVALMADALLLRGGERILEIGTGSGYAAAVLAEIAARSIRSNASDNWQKRLPPSWLRWGTTMCTCCMVTARKDGQSMHRTMLLWSPRAAQKFRNLYSHSLRSAGGL